MEAETFATPNLQMLCVKTDRNLKKLLWRTQALLWACFVDSSAHFLGNLPESFVLYRVQISNVLPMSTTHRTSVLHSSSTRVQSSTEPALKASSSDRILSAHSVSAGRWPEWTAHGSTHLIWAHLLDRVSSVKATTASSTKASTNVLITIRILRVGQTLLRTVSVHSTVTTTEASSAPTATKSTTAPATTITRRLTSTKTASTTCCIECPVHIVGAAANSTRITTIRVFFKSARIFTSSVTTSKSATRSTRVLTLASWRPIAKAGAWPTTSASIIQAATKMLWSGPKVVALILAQEVTIYERLLTTATLSKAVSTSSSTTPWSERISHVIAAATSWKITLLRTVTTTLDGTTSLHSCVCAKLIHTSTNSYRLFSIWIELILGLLPSLV